MRAGAEIILNLSASPFTIEKRHLRPRMLAATARRWRRPLLFVNQVGGQDDLVFDGASLALDATGQVVARGAEHETDLIIVDALATLGRRRRRFEDRLRCRRPSAVRALRREGGARGARARHARLRAPLWLLARAARPFGRHRLGAGRLPRGARPRAGERARRRDAVALLVARVAGRRRGAGQEPGDRLHRRLDRTDVRRLPRDPGAGAGAVRRAEHAAGRGSRCRLDRPEPAGARARRDPDGALQPAGSAAAQHRQQERDRHRLLHALRRHGWRAWR